jgi:hypothetical protein
MGATDDQDCQERKTGQPGGKPTTGGGQAGGRESIGEEDGTDLYRHSPTGNSSIDRNAVKAPSGRWRPNREK